MKITNEIGVLASKNLLSNTQVTQLLESVYSLARTKCKCMSGSDVNLYCDRNDIVQDAVSYAWTSFKNYNPEKGDFDSFIAGCLRNGILKSIGSNKRRDDEVLAESLEYLDANLVDEETIFSEIYSKDTKTLLLQLLEDRYISIHKKGRTRARTKHIASLYLDGYKGNEIIEMTGYQKNQVYVTLREIIAEIKKITNDIGGDI